MYDAFVHIFPIVVVVFSIALAIAGLAVFFTFWGPVYSKFNDQVKTILGAVTAENLSDRSGRIKLKSNEVVEGMKILGTVTLDYKQFLSVCFNDGRTGFIRLDEVMYFELDEVVETKS